MVRSINKTPKIDRKNSFASSFAATHPLMSHASISFGCVSPLKTIFRKMQIYCLVHFNWVTSSKKWRKWPTEVTLKNEGACVQQCQKMSTSDNDTKAALLTKAFTNTCCSVFCCTSKWYPIVTVVFVFSIKRIDAQSNVDKIMFSSIIKATQGLQLSLGMTPARRRRCGGVGGG